MTFPIIIAVLILVVVALAVSAIRLENGGLLVLAIGVTVFATLIGVFVLDDPDDGRLSFWVGFWVAVVAGAASLAFRLIDRTASRNNT